MKLGKINEHDQVVVLNKIDLPHVRSRQEELEAMIKAELDHTRFMSIRCGGAFCLALCGVVRDLPWNLCFERMRVFIDTQVPPKSS